MIWGQHRIRPTKTDVVCPSWIILDYDGEMLQATLYRTDGTEWWRRGLWRSDMGLSLWQWIASYDLPRETWVVGWDMYPALCASRLYDHVESSQVQIPYRLHQSGIETLARSMSCYDDVTIVDLSIGGSQLHCIDLRNLGIERAHLAGIHDDRMDQSVTAIRDYVELCQRSGMGRIQSTAAAQSWYSYRRQHVPQLELAVPGRYGANRGERPADRPGIYVHSIREVRQLERRAFGGGRCECYRLGVTEGPIWYLDIRSMYPSIGLRELFPVELEDHGQTLSLDDASILLWAWDIIADVTVYTRDPAYHVRESDRTYYPVGTYRTTMTAPELRYALDSGHVQSIGQWAMYRTDPIFVANTQWYYDTLDSLHDWGLAHMAPALKKCQVSMYCKIGANGRRWVPYPPDDLQRRWGMWEIPHPDTGEITVARSIQGHHQYMSADVEPPNCCPSISATMTAYGRMLLWQIITIAGRDQIIYCDTDGILVTDEGRMRLHQAGWCTGERGQLAVKGLAQWADVRGLKHYCLGGIDYPDGGEWTQAGVPRGHPRLDGGDVVLTEHERIGQSLWQHRPLQQAHRTYRVPGRPQYRHGDVDGNGVVTPYVLSLSDGETA